MLTSDSRFIQAIGFVYAILVCSVSAFSQEDSGTAVPIVTGEYIAMTYNGDACNTFSGSLGASGSGVATCSGTDMNDVWYTFNAQTQAIKVDVETSDFDMVIEILDAGLNFVACEDTYAVNGGEVLYSSTLVSGDDYFIRIHSTDGTGGSFDGCVQHLPACEVRSGWYPTKNTDLGLPGYRVNETINRTNYSPTNNLIEATRWMFVDVDNGDTFTTVVNGSNGILNLNSVGGICFDRTYDVFLEVQVDGFWCGYSVDRQIYTEEFPTTELEPGYAGQFYDMTEDLKARFVGDGQNVEWRLTTDNGNTVLTHTGLNSSSLLYFFQVDCIRYNKIYTVEVRAEFCGIIGPWSDPSFVILNPLPYINVRDEFCNTVQYAGTTIACEYLPVVDQYAWQFAPIDPDDPTMTPIGPAIVTYSVGTTALYLQPLGLEDITYRVGVKSLIGLNDNCNDEQQSDYGNFCPITFGIPAQLTPANPNELAPEQPEDAAMNSLKVYPNPAPQFGFTAISLAEIDATGTAFLDIYDLSGRLVSSEQVLRIQDADYLQFAVPSESTSGRYQIVLHGENFKYTAPLYVK